MLYEVITVDSLVAQLGSGVPQERARAADGLADLGEAALPARPADPRRRARAAEVPGAAAREPTVITSYSIHYTKLYDSPQAEERHAHDHHEKEVEQGPARDPGRVDLDRCRRRRAG